MSRNERVRGFDSIRFICACFVAIGHTQGFPLLQGIDTSTRVGWTLHALYGASTNGPAAVIVFFLISGFCIHFQYRNGEKLQLSRYYPRRYLRILVPVAGCLAVVHLAGISVLHFNADVLWSIVCEEIYYLIYPLLLLFHRRYGWNSLLVTSFLLAIIVAWTKPRVGHYAAYGWQLNWLLGLPCWLLGCRLADKADSLFSPVSVRSIWSWRLVVWITSGVLLGLRFHSPIGYSHTLNYFAILSYFWLQREIRYFRNWSPPRFLEWGGKWSYSLYLLHLPANAFYGHLAVPNLGFILNWFCRFGWILGCAYVFYLLVERPSHLFARWVGRRRSAGDDNRRLQDVPLQRGDAILAVRE